MSGSDVLERCEDILATLAAAETQLRVFASQHLPFAAVVRIHRNAVANARAILAGAGIPPARIVALAELGGVDDSTDELLSKAVRAPSRPGAPAALVPPANVAENRELPQEEEAGATFEALDVGPEGAEDLELISEEVDSEDTDPSIEVEAPNLDDGLVAFDEPDSEEQEEEYIIGVDEPTPIASDVIYDDVPTSGEDTTGDDTGDDEQEGEADEEPEAAAEDEDEQEEAGDDVDEVPFGDGLVAFEEDEHTQPSPESDEPLIRFDEGIDTASLVQFDEEDEDESEETLPRIPSEGDEGTEHDDEPDDLDLVAAGNDDASLQEYSEPDEDAFDDEDATLVVDFGRPEDIEDSPTHVSVTDTGVETFDLMPDAIADDLDDQEDTLVHDLNKFVDYDLGAADDSEEIELHDLDPEPLSTDDMQFIEELDIDDDSVDEASADEVIQRKANQEPRVQTRGRFADSPSVPTIRDGTSPRPRAAAVQIGAEGEASVVEGDEEMLIELGEADYEEDSSPGGFSINVEEYEEYDPADDEDSEVVEAAPPTPPPPEPVGPTPEEVAFLLEKALSAVGAGDMDAGVNLFSDVLDADPDNVEAHIGRGRIYLDFGDYARAMSDFTVAEELAADSPEPQIAIGDLYFARKEYRKAIDYFNAALDVSPEHAMAHCRRGISHYYRRNYTQALEDLSHAQKLDAAIPNIKTYISMAKKKAR